MGYFFESKDGTKFYYEADMEGIVTVDGVPILGRTMIEFVAEFVRIQRSIKMEEQSPEEILDF